MHEKDLVLRIQKIFAPPCYATIPQVANSTGFDRQRRTADAISMSLWPSRGLYLHGFEIKVNRSDWLKELRTPEKADPIANHCHFWWIVVSDHSVCKVEELPEGWGLYVATDKSLKKSKAATYREATPPDHAFLAAILRRAAPTSPMDSPDMLAKIAEIRKEQMEYWETYFAGQIAVERAESKKLADKIRSFEQAAGVRLDEWRFGKITDRIRMMQVGLTEDAMDDLRRIASQTERLAFEVKQSIDQLEGVTHA